MYKEGWWRLVMAVAMRRRRSIVAAINEKNLPVQRWYRFSMGKGAIGAFNDNK